MTKNLTTDRFTWNTATRTLSAEVSELEHECNFHPTGSPLTLVSQRTGKSMTFAPTCVQGEDNDGEITAWVYENADAKIKVMIFND